MYPADMLERHPEPDTEVKREFTGKRILVTGGTGSIGSHIAEALKSCDTEVIRIISNDENGVFELSNRLDGDRYRFFVGDIRDKERLVSACENVDLVFHAAALKHVPLCEYNPIDAVKTNVIGTQNLIEACLEQNVGKMIFISTDKAVEPINTMGATKLLAEKLVINANFYRGDKNTVFSIVRFGNVIGSRGSVIPFFIEQAMNGGPITLTDDNMTRFMMSLEDAVNLIFKAAQLAREGDIFTFDMPVANMKDIAEVIREEIAPKIGKRPEEIEIRIIGIRPGERLYESLMTKEEADRAVKIGNLFRIPPVIPDIPGMEEFETDAMPVGTENNKSDAVRPLEKAELKALLDRFMRYYEG